MKCGLLALATLFVMPAVAAAQQTSPPPNNAPKDPNAWYMDDEIVPPESFKGEWYSLGQSTDGGDWSLDMEQYVRVSSTRPKQFKIWVKADYSKVKAVAHRTRMMQVRIDCSAQTVAHLYVALFFPNGESKVILNSAAGRNVAPIVPETMTREIADELCD